MHRFCEKMSELGEEFAKINIQLLKKSSFICVLTAFCPRFPHLETLKKNIGKLNSLT